MNPCDFPPPYEENKKAYPPNFDDKPPATAPGYSNQQQVYPPQQQGFAPQQQGYPPQQQGFAPQQQGYPPQQQGYPPQQQGYIPQQQGYIPQPQGFPPQQQGFPPQGYLSPNPQGYHPPQQVYQQPVMHQPAPIKCQNTTTTVVVGNQSLIGTKVCGDCGSTVVPDVITKPGCFAFVMCLLIALILPYGCCFIPFCAAGFQDVHHICPNCRKTLEVVHKC